MELSEVEFTKLPVCTQILTDMYTFANSLEIQQFQCETMDGLITRIKGYVLAEEVDCRSTVVCIDTVHPAYQSWWQHFKGEIFPEWLKRRFPPKLNYITKTGRKKVTFRRYATYPKANILFPKETGKLVRYRSFIGEE
ncbi:hypothetical protein LCGC14_2040100 [marine sediment metagenome]|uniref:Uncharacterized protein n=1 Tax=marine sediment metagenome TaxID=412755 RepID=A0A0F9FER6_9ZZZZ